MFSWPRRRATMPTSASTWRCTSWRGSCERKKRRRGTTNMWAGVSLSNEAMVRSADSRLLVLGNDGDLVESDGKDEIQRVYLFRRDHPRVAGDEPGQADR